MQGKTIHVSHVAVNKPTY